LIPYARNARTHSPEQVAQIAASIREFGFTIPVLVDEQDTLIAGHGRVLAAQQLDACINVTSTRSTSSTSRHLRARAGARIMRAREAEWPADQVERWPIAKLIPYARNARTHSDEQVAQIAASIREWGWTVTVLVNEQGTLIAGHGRVLAAHQLDACINRDVDHGGLVDHQQVAFEWVVAAAFEPAALGIHFASRRRSQLFGYGQSTIGRGAPTNGSGAPSLLVPAS
jgi:hypothetical protein